jgi:DNA-binding GntR family transcriptional regulator
MASAIRRKVTKWTPRPAASRSSVSARLATADERRLLQLPDPCAVIVTHHTVVDADDLVLDFSESVGPPDSWSVEHEYPIGR